MTAYQFNGKYYDPDLAQLGDGASAGTAYGFREGNWRVNLSRFFGDFTAHIAGLVTSSINGSNIFGHETQTSATSITLSNSNKRSQAITYTAAGQATKMPNATTIVKGEVWHLRHITNAAAVQDNSGGVILASLAPGDELDLWLEANGTAAGSWRYQLIRSLARSLIESAAAAAMRTTLDLDTVLIGRNRIINGAMRIDQRNEGGGVVTGLNTSKYGIDRWIQGATGAGNFTVTRTSASPPTGFTHYARITVGTADAALAGTDSYVFGQRIEGLNIWDLLWGSANARTAVLSFWVRSSLTGAFGGVILNSAGNRIYPFTYTINAANTWEYKTVVITGETSGSWALDNSTGVAVYFSLGGASLAAAGAWGTTAGVVGATGQGNIMSSTANTWDLTGVQFEANAYPTTPAATLFEWRDHGRELMLSQRYYQKSHLQGTVPATGAAGYGCVGYATNGNGVHAWADLAVVMRTNIVGAGVISATGFSGTATPGILSGTLFGGSAPISSVSFQDRKALVVGSNCNSTEPYHANFALEAEL